jgi:hypothetical protein
MYMVLEVSKLNSKSIVISALLLCIALFPGSAFATFVPHQGDYFNYYEVIDVGSGSGDYAGYTDHTVVTGTETINGVTQDGIVSAHFSYTWDFSSNDGSTDSGSSSGDFTFSSTTFRYVNGTDDQVGYVNPTVWFCIDNSIPEGGSFYLLDTLMTVKSKEYSYFLRSENRNVHAIFAQGDASYQRNDEYGQFTATYTWKAYFDSVSGYIIGYDYTEHDTNPSAGFTYTEKLYITQASYQLQTGPPTAPDFFSELLKYAVLIVIILVVVAVILIVYAVSRGRRRLPRHSAQRPVYTPPSDRPPPPPRQDIDLTPEQAPVQQIVVKEIVKVNCRYCGALIDSRVTNCPYCGAPRR